MRRFDRSLPGCHQTEHDLLLPFYDNAAKLSEYSWAKARQLLRHDFPATFVHVICMDRLVVLYVNTHGELGSCRKTVPAFGSSRPDSLVPLQYLGMCIPACNIVGEIIMIA